MARQSIQHPQDQGKRVVDKRKGCYNLYKREELDENKIKFIIDFMVCIGNNYKFRTSKYFYCRSGRQPSVRTDKCKFIRKTDEIKLKQISS